MNIFKRLLTSAFALLILLTLFTNLGLFPRYGITVEAADLTKTNRILLARQGSLLSPEQKAEAQRRAEDLINQKLAQRAENDKPSHEQFVVVIIILTILLFPFYLIVGGLISKSPWYLKIIISIALSIIVFWIIWSIYEALRG
ncbi:MAG: hypothetical protein UW51_C0006G0188 [Candidatus Amesbacteria bacterium GW2011_GWA1_44_24]|nr:MAG: hypothetical protein UW51_C0006G0188 [Candidatus Amesbacteria bacterium GW2011_GWA1_44_24]